MGLPVWRAVLDGCHFSFPGAVLSIDRMQHPSTPAAHRYPRYHSNLFRGQDAWDPHTHVLLPSQSPRPSLSEGESLWVTSGQVLSPCSSQARYDTRYALANSPPAPHLTIPLLARPSSQALSVPSWGPCSPYSSVLREARFQS